MRPPIFLFGTLQHLPLLEALVGDTSRLRCTPTELPGYGVMRVREGPFPTITRDPSLSAAGLLVSGLTDSACAALDFYESIYDYRLKPVETADGQRAEAYFPPQTGVTPAGEWSLSDWARDWGEIVTTGAREVLQYRDHKSPEQLRWMLPMIWARAASNLRAKESKHGEMTLRGDVEVLEQSRAYAHFFALDEYRLRHTRFDGRSSEAIDRAVFVSPDAAIVLPYDPQRDTVLLVEQFRMGPLARGDRYRWQLEPIAGRIDASETPEAAARREAEEEAGIGLGVLHPVAEVYASPGTSSEFYYIFVGTADLPAAAASIGGLADEHEDIRSHLMPFEALIALCDRLEAANTPLVIAAFWLARHRSRLRAEAGISAP